MTPVAELADAARLVPWHDAGDLEADEPITITPLTGGTSNVMSTVDRGGHGFVLHRPDQAAPHQANGLTSFDVVYNLRLAMLLEGSYPRSVSGRARTGRRDLVPLVSAGS